MPGKGLAWLFLAGAAVGQHIEYGSWIRQGLPTLAPAEDSKGDLIVLSWNLALGLGPAPNSTLYLLNRYGRDGSSRLLADTELAGRGSRAALLAVGRQDRIYVGVNREAEPVLGRFGPGEARRSVALFVPFTQLVAIRFAANGDPIVLGKESADGKWTIQLVRLDAETLAPKAQRLMTGLPASANALAVDREGAVYVAGSAFSADLGLAQASTTIGRAEMGGAFVLKLSPDFERVEYATVIGGRTTAGAAAIEIAADGSVYLAGSMLGLKENLFPTTADAFQTELPGERSLWASRGFVTGPSAAFVTRLSTDGSQLLASTFVAGSVSDSINGLAIDANGKVIVHGTSRSLDFPATGVFGTQCGPDRGRAYEATFITRLDADLRRVEKSILAAGMVSNGLPQSTMRGQIFFVVDRGLATLDLDRDEPSDVACVVNGASYRKLSQVVPGQLVTLFGRNIGPESLQVFETGEALPLAADGIEVLINGEAAPILAALSTQLNVVAPSSAGSGEQRIEVKRKGERIFFRPMTRGEYNAAAMLQVGEDGKAIAAAESETAFLADARNEDGTLNGPENPAAVGSLVTVFTSGLGELDAAIPDFGYGDGLAKPRGEFVIDTPQGRLTEIEAATVPRRTRAVNAIRFRVPELSGNTLPFAVQPLLSSPVMSASEFPNFLYVRN